MRQRGRHGTGRDRGLETVGERQRESSREEETDREREGKKRRMGNKPSL